MAENRSKEKRTRKRKPKLQLQAYIVRPFLMCLLIFAVANLIFPTKQHSESENRSLTQRPKLTLSSVASGSFMEQYESYQTDQFIGRDFFRAVKVRIDSLSGKKEENGVFNGKKGQLLEDIVVPDKESLNKNLEAIRTFRQGFSDVTASMILVPDAAAVLEDKLPSLATVADQSVLIKSVKRTLGEEVSWIDAESVMNAHKDEKIYYKTDHHWTTLGAYYVFQESGDALGVQAKDQQSTFLPYPVTTTFNGSLASKSGYETKEKEQIDIYVPQDDIQVVVNQVEEKKKITSLYSSDNLKSKDKYMVFLGGNFGLLDIKTTANSTRRLIVFKDSYANCFIPFLTPYFREIVVVDPRYYSGNATDLMSTYGITDMLFLYNANTFFADNNISGVLTGE